ncbi:S8 family peptidase [Falsibacillus albus]|uniref:Peptidase S8 n=1 Tax=Falsibacillus albus TaxID=2478915 RepID=A0A3L7JVR9_9BACI|nr:S8/S53 family peptidase [Falsibacillus albus]RLQ94846.1 peptidase S8 [Falsibacillus albus]
MKKKSLIITVLLLVAFSVAFFIGTKYSHGEQSIKLISGNNYFPYKGKTPDIGIIDTGIQTTHQYLEESNIDQYYLDDLSKTSQQMHGTMVAGILARQNKGTGTLPNAHIISIQAGTDMGMTSKQLASAIYLAVKKGVKVLNISMGTTKNEPILEESVSNAIHHGVIIVASNGNKASEKKYYPASYSGVINVGAIAGNSKVINPSDIGKVDIFAPGNDIKTIMPNRKELIKFDGNSAATPLVASAAALIINENPNLDPEEVKKIIIQTAKINKEDNQSIPVLDVSKAIKRAKEEKKNEK